MRLRTSALYAGILGAVLLAVSLIAQSQRLEPIVVASVTTDSQVVVIPAKFVALEGAIRVAFEADSVLAGHTARPTDADAWLSSRAAVAVTGLPTWETLQLEDYLPGQGLAQVTASPDAVPSPEASPAASPSPEATAEGEQAPEAETASDPATAVTSPTEGSQDHWRQSWRGEGRLSVAVSDVDKGLPLIVYAEEGSISAVEVTLERELNDGWMTPLMWWGVALTAVGLVALFLMFVDVRPGLRVVEQWMFNRQRGAQPAPEPGSRRARRLAGPAIPQAPLEPDAADAALEQGALRAEGLESDEQDSETGGKA